MSTKLNGRDAKCPKRRQARCRGSSVGCTSLTAFGGHGSSDGGGHGSGDALPGRRPLPGRLAVLVTRTLHMTRISRSRRRGTDDTTDPSEKVKYTVIAAEFCRGGA
jgi:hypothetical protein